MSSSFTKVFLSLLQFAALTTGVAVKHKPDPDKFFSCRSPIPRFDNGSIATSWAQYLDEAGAELGQNDQGATDLFAGPVGKAPLRWPRNSDNKVVIPYCYDTEEDRNSVLPVMHVAIETWMSFLDTPSKESGHTLSFEEYVTSEGKPMYCTPDSKKPGDWNSALPHETLAIFWGRGKMQWQADVGLQPNQEAPWRNAMYVGDDHCVSCAIHELGHVMGMIHEHQRSDRDKYIKVQYENINDFEECWKRAEAKGDPKVTRSNICSNIKYALEFNCGCSAWTMGITSILLPLFAFDSYDIDSVMHYPSSAGGTLECPVYELEKSSDHCPIQVYIDYEDHSKGLTILTPNLRPSAQDIRWVQHVYPYDQKS